MQCCILVGRACVGDILCGSADGAVTPGGGPGKIVVGASVALEWAQSRGKAMTLGRPLHVLRPVPGRWPDRRRPLVPCEKGAVWLGA